MTTRLQHCLCLIVFLPVLIATEFAYANPAVIPESVALAKAVEIADVHMHVLDKSADWHKTRMDRNNVKWGGGVGPAVAGGGGGWPKPAEMTKVLGTRYFFALGQDEFSRVFFSGGPAGLADPSSIAFVEMFAVADQMLSKREAYGFGELHIDNSKSFSSHRFARTIQFDNPVVRKMFELADKHQAVLQFHMQADNPTNLEALKRYLREFPKAKVVLSHSLPFVSLSLLKDLLSGYQNVFVELSNRGSTLGTRELGQAYNRSGPKAGWLNTIEEFPNRFMLGSDAYGANENRYDDVISEIREGLLPYLKPETLKKVAHQNAAAVFGLR